MSSFPDDALRQLMVELVRSAGLLNPAQTHEHGGLHVSMTDLMALGELSGAPAGSLTQQDLGARLGLEKSTVSRLVAGLEKREWVTRQRDPANHRYFRLRLTPQGQEAAQVAGAHFREHHEHLLAGMTQAEQEALKTGLTALVRQMRVIHQGAHPHSG